MVGLVDRARELLAQGLSERAVARELNVPRTTLRRRLHGDERRFDGLSSRIDVEELPVIVRDYSHLDHLYAYPLGDVHIGSSVHQGERWAEWLEYLTTAQNVSMIGTGDFLNSALKDSKSEAYDEAFTVGAAKRLLRGQLEPLAERIDVMIPGNHEARIYRAVGDCPIEDICDYLRIPYARAAVLLLMIVGDVEYQVLVRHGTGDGQSLLAMNKGQQSVPFADVHITGHTHRQAVTTDDYLVYEGGRMVRRHVYKVNSGSFMGWEHYAIERGYAPTRIGAPRIYLDGRKRDVHASL